MSIIPIIDFEGFYSDDKNHRQEIVNMVKINNLKIYKYKSIGLLTNKEKSSIIPWNFVSKVENYLYKKNQNHLMGYNVIYLIGK